MIFSAPDTLRRLSADESGATLPEFAMIAPTFLLLLFGIYDVGHTIYVRSILQGALQDAGRNAGLESGVDEVETIDAYVRRQVLPIVPSATFEITRSNYENFTDVGRPEDFTDSNNNGVYDEGECFIDENGNEMWDEDVGKSGLGGANDVVLFEVSVSYNRLFPLWKMLGQSEKSTISAATILRNQPFGGQAKRVKRQICPVI